MATALTTKWPVRLALPCMAVFVLISFLRFNSVQDVPISPAHPVHIQTTKLFNPAAFSGTDSQHYYVRKPARKSSLSDFTRRFAKRLRSSKSILKPAPTVVGRNVKKHLSGPPHDYREKHSLSIEVNASRCEEAVEIGRAAGWVCKPLRKPCRVVSLRGKSSIVFDAYLKEEEGCEVVGIDVPAGRGKERISLAFPDGLSVESKVTRDIRLRAVDSKFKGLEVKEVSVLRVDAEGAEWFFLNDLIEADWEQLIVQLHFPTRYEVAVEKGEGVNEVLRIVDNGSETGDVDAYAWLRFLLRYGHVWKATVLEEHVVNLYLIRSRPRTGEVAKLININNVLWSRNWRHMVDCKNVPDRYYAAPTESRFYPQDLASFFSNCGGVIWVRLSTGRKNDVQTFIRRVLPKMKLPFRLVTTDGDNAVPSSIMGAGKLLNSPLLLGWYTQNYDGSIVHPKLHAVPIGLDLHTYRRGLWEIDPPRKLKRMNRIRLAMRLRNDKILTDGMQMRPNRVEMDISVSCIPHDHSGHWPVSVIWNKYTKYSFGFSPHGNGLDCHRTWEMLFFGLIPIVKSSSLDVLYQRLPVMILNDWEDICVKSKFEAAFKRLEPYLEVPNDMFTMNYWLDIQHPNASATVLTNS